MYRLELWNPAHATRLGILEAESAHVIEELNGEHTLECAIDFKDPIWGSVAPRQIIRLVDESIDPLWTQISSVSTPTSNQVWVGANSDFATGDFVWIQSSSRPYPTKVTSVNASSPVIHINRVIDAVANHTNALLYKIGFDWYRIRGLEENRDENGILVSNIQAEHFSYDLQDRLHLHKGITDFAYALNQQGGEIVAADAVPTDIASHIFQNFSGTSFTSGVVNVTDRKEISFSRENCLTSWRKLPEVWDLDERINKDYTADLLAFIGQVSHLQVRYQLNLHAIRRHTDCTSLATVVYPIGATSEWEDTFTGVSGSVTSGNHTRSVIYLTSGHGVRFRYGDVILVWYAPVTGTATSGDINTLTKTAAGWNDNQHLGKMILITAGTGVGQVREIKSNTATVITIVGTWKVTPDSTSQFSISAYPPEITDIFGFGLDTGTASSGAAGSLTDSSKTWTSNLYASGTVEILEGTGAGQVRTVSSNTGTVLTVSTNFNPAPDNTSKYRVKALPHKSDTVTVSELDRIPASGDVLYLALTEEGPLTPGKDYNYRDTVVNYTTSATTIQVNDETKFAKARAIRIYETELNSMAIPQLISQETFIASVLSSGWLGLSQALASVPNSHAQVEVISFWDSAAAASWGEIATYFFKSDEHSAYQLAQDALKHLQEVKSPKVRYSVTFGDLYEADRIGYDAMKVNIGDIFDVVDEALPTSNETLTNGTIYTSLVSSGTVITLTATPVPGWYTDQWRGKKVEAGGTRGVIWTNNASQLTTEGFSTAPNTLTSFAILSAMRIVKKEWNPFDPADLRIEVANPHALDFYDSLVDITQEAKSVSERAARAVQLSDTPRCLYWNPKQRRCQRQNYPNWFCQSEFSNRDGRLTNRLKPITVSDCSAWRPVEADQIGGGDPIAQGGTVTGVTNDAYDTTSRFAVDVDVIVSTASFAEVVGVVDEASPSVAIDVTTAAARIQIDAQGEVVPYNTTTRKGCYVQVRRASGSASLKVRALGMIFGANG